MESSDPDMLHFGLGDVADGEWHLVSRDLEEDLRSIHPDVQVLQVQTLLIYGSLMLDEVTLFNFGGEFVEN